MAGPATTHEQRMRAIEAAQQRLVELQGPLGGIVTQALALHDEIFPIAPRPIDMPDGFPVWGVATINLEPSEELNIKLPDRRTLSVHKHPLSATPEFPLHRVWLWRPQSAGKLRRVEVLELAGSALRYGVETSIWEDKRVNARYLELVDHGYEDKDSDMREVTDAIRDARPFAIESIEKMATRSEAGGDNGEA